MHLYDSGSVVLRWDDLAVEYGLESYLGHNWYVKFSLEGDQGLRIINELSFHPVEQTLMLADPWHLRCDRAFNAD